MMKSAFSLLALLVLGATAQFNSGSNFCQDETDRYDNCKPLVSREGCGCSHEASSSSSSSSESGGDSGEISGSGSGSGNSTWEISGSGSGSGVEGGSGSGSSDGWEKGEYCYLLQVFWNFSLTLDVELQFIFQEWINETQITIVEDESLTEYKILVKIWYSLDLIIGEYSGLESIKWVYISKWQGYVINLEGLAIDIQSSGSTQISIQEVISGGSSCPLITALKDCEQNATSSQQAEIELLIESITVIINGYYSFDETLVLIYEEFASFFEEYSDLKALIFSGEIEGFGIIQSYFDICNTYWRIANFSIAVSGSSSSDCELLSVLTQLYENESYTISERSDFKQLEVKIQDYFSTEVSVQLRVQYFAEQLYQFYILDGWTVEDIYSLEIKGYGSVYDLIYAYIYCTNNGVGPGDFTVSTESTTTISTSTSTTTTTTTTTTVPNGNCATVTEVNVVSSNTTLLLAAIDADQQTSHWNATLIATFLGYKKKIYNYSINTTLTAVQKFTSIKTVLTGFTTKSDFLAIVDAIFIQTWGTIKEYVSCTLS